MNTHKLKLLTKKLLNLLNSLLQRRLRIGIIFLPIYTLLLTVLLVVLVVITSINHRNDTLKQMSLRSHNRHGDSMDDVFSDGCSIPLQEARANATLVMLTRNEELKDVIKSMDSLERHFNQWYQYPWVFLNDVEFTQDFKDEVVKHTNGHCHFGSIDPQHWEFPYEVKESIQSQGDRGIMYGSMDSYHKMCRFYSGFFYKHPLVQQFEWYWRVEPDVSFFCDITYDPFVQMMRSGKKYGFSIIIKELFETIPNLFRYTKTFMQKNNIIPKSSWSLFVQNYKDHWKITNIRKFNTFYKNMRFNNEVRDRAKDVVLYEALMKQIGALKDPLRTDQHLQQEQINALIDLSKMRSKLPVLQGETMDEEDYNLFHFWSNFEIARVDLWDNELYESYFQYLDQSGGFINERWGDAPVHSLAVGFMLELDQIHYFRDMGYQHTTIRHCPSNSLNQLEYKQAEDYTPIPKLDQYFKQYDTPKAYGVGCRCRCPKDIKDIEDTDNDFLKPWFDLNRKAKKKQVSIFKEEKKVRDRLKKERLV